MATLRPDTDATTAPEDIYAHVQDFLDHSRLVYENGYYQVYVPEQQPDHP